MPPCKCCNAPSGSIGSLDFTKSCEDRRTPGGHVFPPSGEAVPYYACPNCGFVFTDYFDLWTAADFKARIYNDQYDLVDHDPSLVNGVEASISYAAGKHLATLLDGNQSRIRLLDFGAGGNPGRMGKGLLDSGFDVTSYEPYFSETATPLTGPYDVIYSIEVFEHCHDLIGTARLVSSNLAEHGLLYFSTLLHPFPTPDNILTSWYIAPRNGHISIFTLKALTILFRRVGINVFQSAFGLIGFKKQPNFPTQIFV
jgi:2-polyprenyl-6-hydroxyphenyl methylase/3-demethylubiquinone-9 3-methyltransferase